MIRLRLLAAWTLGIAGLIATSPRADAEFFEFSSKISITGYTSPAGSVVTNDAGGLMSTLDTPNGNQVTLNALSSNPAIPRNNAMGLGTDIVPLNVNVNSAFGTEVVSLDFELTLRLTDYAASNSPLPTGGSNPVDFVFFGTLSGQLGNFQTNLSLATFIPSQAIAQVGGAMYTIELRNFSSPGTDSDGRLSLHVTAFAVPEPASVTMIGLGGAGLLGIHRRRQQKSRA